MKFYPITKEGSGNNKHWCDCICFMVCDSLMSAVMGSLTFAYKLGTEVGQVTLGQIAKQSLFPFRVTHGAIH